MHQTLQFSMQILSRLPYWTGLVMNSQQQKMINYCCRKNPSKPMRMDHRERRTKWTPFLVLWCAAKYIYYNTCGKWDIFLYMLNYTILYYTILYYTILHTPVFWFRFKATNRMREFWLSSTSRYLFNNKTKVPFSCALKISI